MFDYTRADLDKTWQTFFGDDKPRDDFGIDPCEYAELSKIMDAFKDTEATDACLLARCIIWYNYRYDMNQTVRDFLQSVYKKVSRHRGIDPPPSSGNLLFYLQGLGLDSLHIIGW
jgi:hypothetical protein